MRGRRFESLSRSSLTRIACLTMGPVFAGCGCLEERRRGPWLPRMEKFSVCSENIVVVGFVCVGRSKGRTLETSCP